MKKCSVCAEEVQNEAVKCRFCGSTLLPQSDAPVANVNLLQRLMEASRRFLRTQPAVVVSTLALLATVALTTWNIQTGANATDLNTRPFVSITMERPIYSVTGNDS